MKQKTVVGQASRSEYVNLFEITNSSANEVFVESSAYGIIRLWNPPTAEDSRNLGRVASHVM